ncbi:hypothetical protein [uncultured Clostridium sp.]|uniref:hypothetical protein n=1 Tax=uncultured Clostridium sp. TaxID=59620 RepID=UPI0028EDA85F|nr:hypothetical protein [uncultured Clostridium sp.]
MKYYFVNDINGKRHIVVANSTDELSYVLKKAKVVPSTYYELEENTFDTAGFLISDK